MTLFCCSIANALCTINSARCRDFMKTRITLEQPPRIAWQQLTAGPEPGLASCCSRLDQLTIRSAAARAAYTDQGRTVLIKAGPFAKVPATPLS